MKRLLLVAVLVAGCGGSATSSRRVQTPVTPTTTATTTPTARVKPRKPSKPANPAPPRPANGSLPPANNGSLPQTDQRPSAATATFKAEMAALWEGVRTDSVHAAMPAFFPEPAYAQVKAIADPQSDWENRLVGNFALDLAAAHRLLSSDAQLVEVNVPADFAHWVPPGSCYNRLGYWEVPNSRVVYRAGGQIRSFGIASMISWRGIWYVVHMGSVTGGGGVVDDPETGPGTSAASSTC